MKNVIKISDNYLTITNDLNVCYDLVKGEENDEKKKLKQEIVLVSVEIWKKTKFRGTNKTNLDILETYLTPDFLTEYFKKPDLKVNPNFSLNYVDAINYVMVKAFYDSSVSEEKKDEVLKKKKKCLKKNIMKN